MSDNPTCNYSHPDDEMALTCGLRKGHPGRHRAVVTWDTEPIDICREVGHVWGEWKPIPQGPSFRADISDILWSSLLGGKWKVTKEATVERYCDRCRSRETDAEGEWEVPPASFLNTIPRVHPHASEMTWVEDRLEGNRE